MILLEIDKIGSNDSFFSQELISCWLLNLEIKLEMLQKMPLASIFKTNKQLSEFLFGRLFALSHIVCCQTS